MRKWTEKELGKESTSSTTRSNVFPAGRLAKKNKQCESELQFVVAPCPTHRPTDTRTYLCDLAGSGNGTNFAVSCCCWS